MRGRREAILKQRNVDSPKIPQEEFPGGLAVKDSMLSLLWLGFNPWPRNFYTPWVWEKKIKKLKI